MYYNVDDESYDPVEDDDAIDNTDVYDNKDNITIKEEADPHPGVPAIIGYDDGNDAEVIPERVYLLN